MSLLLQQLLRTLLRTLNWLSIGCAGLKTSVFHPVGPSRAHPPVMKLASGQRVRFFT